MDEMRWICVSDVSIVDSSIEWEIQYYNVIKHVRIAIFAFALGRATRRVQNPWHDSRLTSHGLYFIGRSIVLLCLTSHCLRAPSTSRCEHSIQYQTSFIRHTSFKYASNAPNLQQMLASARSAELKYAINGDHFNFESEKVDYNRFSVARCNVSARKASAFHDTKR